VRFCELTKQMLQLMSFFLICKLLADIVLYENYVYIIYTLNLFQSCNRITCSYLLINAIILWCRCRFAIYSGDGPISSELYIHNIYI